MIAKPPQELPAFGHCQEKVSVESSGSCPGKVEWGTGGIMCRGRTSLRNWVSNCSVNCHLMCVSAVSKCWQSMCWRTLCMCRYWRCALFICLRCTCMFKCCSYQSSAIIIHHTLLIFSSLLSSSPNSITISSTASHPSQYTHSQHQQHVYKPPPHIRCCVFKTKWYQPPIALQVVVFGNVALRWSPC